MRTLVIAAAAALVTLASASAAVVRSHSGVAVQVNPAARAKLQCVVDKVERAGVRIRYMRGYGPGTVRASLHPSGMALDINQTGRDRAPGLSRRVGNAAASACGVVAGANWGWADHGHFQVGGWAGRSWPRVLAAKKAAPRVASSRGTKRVAGRSSGKQRMATALYRMPAAWDMHRVR